MTVAGDSVVIARLLEGSIRRLTQPVNGQYPRPWMTEMMHPEEARVFVVGYNQATGFPAEQVGDHETYIDALFNRNEKSCRKLYEKFVGMKAPAQLERTSTLCAGT
jgi:hypothetical protein